MLEYIKSVIKSDTLLSVSSFNASLDGKSLGILHISGKDFAKQHMDEIGFYGNAGSTIILVPWTAVFQIQLRKDASLQVE